MTSTSLLALAGAGFTVAFFHAALPTHWLPFVLVGRFRGWRPAKILSVTGLAGAGHVFSTILLGVILTGAGLALAPQLGSLFPKIVGGFLIVIGLFYLLRQALRPAHAHADPTRKLGHRSEGAAIVSLVAVLTLSPCEAFLPIYLANLGYGWSGFLTLSLVLAFGTAAAMLLFTSLCLAGADRLKLERLERYEAALIGVALLGLGLFEVLGS